MTNARNGHFILRLYIYTIFSRQDINMYYSSRNFSCLQGSMHNFSNLVWLANVEVTCLEDPKDTRRLKYYR